MGGGMDGSGESVRPPRDNAPSSVIATITLIPPGVTGCGTSYKEITRRRAPGCNHHGILHHHQMIRHSS